MDTAAPFLQSRPPWTSRKVAIILACLAVASAGLRILYEDIYLSRSHGTGQSFAVLTKTESFVKRKASDSFIWSFTNQGDTVFKKDSIQTGMKSSASLTLLDGRSLELGENSLLVLNYFSDLSLNYLNGTAVIQDQSGTKQLSVDANGKKEIKELLVNLQKPGPSERFFATDQKPVSVAFSWTKARSLAASAGGKPEDAPFVLQVSPNRNFEKAETTESRGEFPIGTYYWRILKSNALVSQVRRFQVYSAHALVPLEPSESDSISAWTGTTSVYFKWRPYETRNSEFYRASRNEIEISTEPGFKDLLFSQDIAWQGEEAMIDLNSTGTFFWRIRSSLDGLEQVSSTRSFKIARAPALKIALTYPPDHGSFEANKDLRFSWFPETQAKGLDYEVQIQKTDAASVPLSFKSSSNDADWKTAQNGAYTWKILARFKTKTVYESETRVFSIVSGKPVLLRTPARNQAFYFWTDPPEFPFQWQGVLNEDGASGNQYEITLAQDVDFKKIAARKRTRKPEISRADLEIQPGVYFWKVTVLNPGGEVLKSSEVSTFGYLVHPVLPAPQRVAENTVFDFSRSKAEPHVAWTPIDHAKEYLVTLYEVIPPAPGARVPADASTPGKFIIQKRTTDPQFSFDGLSEGSFRWTVQAIDILGRPGAIMSPEDFRVTYGQTVKPIRPKFKEVQ